MPKMFRLWGKKRGERRTGSNLAGSLGEALFFGALFLLGVVSLTTMVMRQFVPSDSASLVPTLAPGFGFWLLLLVLASFVLIGGAGVIYTVLRLGASAERRSALARKAATMNLLQDTHSPPRDFPGIPSDADLTNSPGIKLAFRLPAAQSPIWQLSAATVFCLVWNGFAAVLTVVALNSRPESLGEWLIAFAVIPFLGVGVWSVNHFVKQMVLYTGIGPTIVEVSAHPLYPGKQYQVFVSQSGRLPMNQFEMFLVCEEEATYHQGTDVRTDKCVVHEQLVFRRENFVIEPGQPFEYQCSFFIPDPTMHSFQSAHNRVSWKLVAKGDARAWPIFFRSFPLVVFPTPAAPAASTEPHNVMQVNV